MQRSTCVIIAHSNTRTETYTLWFCHVSFWFHRLWDEWMLYHVWNITCFRETHRGGYLGNYLYVFPGEHAYFLKFRQNLWMWFGTGHSEESKWIAPWKSSPFLSFSCSLWSLEAPQIKQTLLCEPLFDHFFLKRWLIPFFFFFFFFLGGGRKAGKVTRGRVVMGSSPRAIIWPFQDGYAEPLLPLVTV